MKILLILPPNQPRAGGNITYSERLKRGLQPLGTEVTIRSLDQVTESDFETADMIHIYNAYRTGRLVLPMVQKLRKPMILTITGTDINEYMDREPMRTETMNVVRYASRIIHLTESSRNELLQIDPSLENKTLVINLGVDLPKGITKTREEWGFTSDEFIFLLPAGIRPVKNPLLAIEPLLALHEQYPQIRFVVAGPLMDEELVKHFLTVMDSHSWTRYLGEVSHEEIPSLLLAADLVLNTSRSEGLSHALLEAMSLQRPVMATNVPGNKDLIDDGLNGLLFQTTAEFIKKGARLLDDPVWRDQLALEGQRTVQTLYSRARETDSFQSMYTSVFEETRMCRCK